MTNVTRGGRRRKRTKKKRHRDETKIAIVTRVRGKWTIQTQTKHTKALYFTIINSPTCMSGLRDNKEKTLTRSMAK